MNPLVPIDPLFSSPAPTGDSSPAKGRSIDGFEKLIDQMVASKLSQRGPSPAAIAAQQSLEDFRHKLAVLSGMLEQAQTAMNSLPPREGGSPNPDADQYFLLKSKLSQVGFPDGVNNLI